jgi:hypothetical protein
VQASLSDKVDLHGGVTTGVVDGTSVNLGNGHFQSYFRYLEEPVIVSKNIAAVAKVLTVKLENGHSRAMIVHFPPGTHCFG